jgi:DNA polymerase III epsilon subunit-like protein
MNYLMLDTETTNELECPFCYDIGFSAITDNGKVLEKHSYVVADIFLDKELMSSAYFADKIPQYWEDIKSGKRLLRKWSTIRAIVRDVMAQYGITTIIAHNMRFDYCSTNTTQRYLTCSKWRYFFPYGTKFACTLKMAREVFGKDETYIKFCEEHEYTTSYGKPRFTAEILYRYLTNNLDFVESHTGLEDVEIEMEILLACKERMPEIDGLLW